MARFPYGSAAAEPIRKVAMKKPAGRVEPLDSADYAYGWNTEPKRPWRRSRRLGSKAKEEPRLPIEGKHDAPAAEPVMAHRPDGHKAILHEMTHGQLQPANRGSITRPSHPLVWESEHATA